MLRILACLLGYWTGVIGTAAAVEYRLGSVAPGECRCKGLALLGAVHAGKRAPQMAVVLGVAIAITSLLLPLSVYPGLPSELTFLGLIFSPFWMPAAFISIWVFVDMAQQFPDLLGPPTGRRRWRSIAALVLVLNCCLLWFGAPRQLAFLHARSAFEGSMAAAPSGCERFDRCLGVYHVDRFAADPRGGIYFRTRSGPDGFYAGMMSYGFSHMPNHVGSPFGDEKYTLSHVGGDWYAFQAARR